MWRRVVDDVARDLLAEALGAHRLQAAARVQERPEQDEAEQRAHLHDLKDVQRACRFAAGDRHHDHRREPANHPGGGLARRGARSRR